MIGLSSGTGSPQLGIFVLIALIAGLVGVIAIVGLITATVMNLLTRLLKFQTINFTIAFKTGMLTVGLYSLTLLLSFALDPVWRIFSAILISSIAGFYVISRSYKETPIRSLLVLLGVEIVLCFCYVLIANF